MHMQKYRLAYLYDPYDEPIQFITIKMDKNIPGQLYHNIEHSYPNITFYKQLCILSIPQNYKVLALE